MHFTLSPVSFTPLQSSWRGKAECAPVALILSVHMKYYFYELWRTGMKKANIAFI